MVSSSAHHITPRQDIAYLARWSAEDMAILRGSHEPASHVVVFSKLSHEDARDDQKECQLTRTVCRREQTST